jgi:poly(A) polymerase
MDHHKEALFIVNKLNKAGYIAYYAGGWVRDLLLQHPSDDIDIATSAPPEKIQDLFPHTVPIGIAFGIILVIIDDKQYEVATFRKDIDYKDGRRPEAVEYTTPFQDALRRDFTINGMFYDPSQDEILDFVEGKKDIHKKIIRAIGDPHERIKEDRLRMIRAIRLACRFNFIIEEETKKAILAHSKELIPPVAIERIYKELQKMSNYNNFDKAIIMLYDYNLLKEIFPMLKNLSTEALKRKVKHLHAFPKKAPLIAKIMELFPNISKADLTSLCEYLKLSNKDVHFAQHLLFTRSFLLERNIEKYTWAHFYANPHSEKCLHIQSLKQDDNNFLKEHEKRQHDLKDAIKRIKHKTPLISSEDLINEGISPGPKMGTLLKEAEMIAINENLKSKKDVFKILRNRSVWKG